MPFSQDLRSRLLLWCDRHCCLCKKPCGQNVEVHHIIAESEGGSNEEDNAIPLCFNCHGEVGRYNRMHPVGTRHSDGELKARRDQIYEEFTRHLVPPVFYQLTQSLPEGGARVYPDVGFELSHVGDSLPVQVRVRLEIVEAGDIVPFRRGFYSGDDEFLWNLNPRFLIRGHFNIQSDPVRQSSSFDVRVHVSVIDAYKRQHQHLPVGYTYIPSSQQWSLNPS